jgi:DNA-directed RNA polymerase sigma subunit (sigma70/sigma32)
MQNKLEQELERDPTVEELSIALEMKEQKVNILIQHNPHPTSLDFHP